MGDATVDGIFQGKEEKNNTDLYPNTLFAEDGSSGPTAPMKSDNHRRTS
jgi:hypothetical protein